MTTEITTIREPGPVGTHYYKRENLYLMFLRENPTLLEKFVLTLCELKFQGADR